MLVFEILAIEILAGNYSLLTFHSFIIDKFKFSKTIKKYFYRCLIIIHVKDLQKEKWGLPGKFFQGIQIDKTRGFRKSDKKSKTGQASFLNSLQTMSRSEITILHV